MVGFVTLVPKSATPGPPAPPGQRKMWIGTEGWKQVLVVPYAPAAVSHTDWAPGYNEAERPGRAPLLERGSEPLPKMSFDLFLGLNDLQHSVELDIALLQTLAYSKTRILVRYGGIEAGLWRITALSIDSITRTLTQSISRATASVEFTKASDANIKVGPVSGGVKPPAKKPPTPAPKPKPAKPRYYVVKKGDTLWDLSVKYYKDGTKWRRIADANGVRNPRLLQIGKKLRIP